MYITWYFLFYSSLSWFPFIIVAGFTFHFLANIKLFLSEPMGFYLISYSPHPTRPGGLSVESKRVAVCIYLLTVIEQWRRLKVKTLKATGSKNGNHFFTCSHVPASLIVPSHTVPYLNMEGRQSSPLERREDAGQSPRTGSEGCLQAFILNSLLLSNGL